MTSQGAKYARLDVRRDIVEAPALIGVSAGNFWNNCSPGTLAIGLWTHYIDPRLAVPLLHPVRREPATADVAVTVSPTLVGTVLIGEFLGYVVLAWSEDLIAAELAGLGSLDRVAPRRPRAHRTLGRSGCPACHRTRLGVQYPSDLVLRSRWVGQRR